MTKNRSQQPVPDAENPEWTPEKFARAKRFHELPQGLQQAISIRDKAVSAYQEITRMTI